MIIGMCDGLLVWVMTWGGGGLWMVDGGWNGGGDRALFETLKYADLISMIVGNLQGRE